MAKTLHRHDSQMLHGPYWNLICLDKAGNGEVWQRIIASSSMQSSGYCALARRGEICRQNMANGEPFTTVLIVGVTSEYGKNP